MTIDRPRCLSVAVASARSATSVVPPGAQGMMNVTGLDGKACAFAKRVVAGSTAAPAARRRNVRRRRVMAFAPGNTETFQHGAVALAERWILDRRLELLPADGTFRCRDISGPRHVRRQLGGYVIAISRRCGG